MTNKKLTSDILLDWEDANQEDVFTDGPYDYDNSKTQIFIDRLNSDKSISKKHKFQSISDRYDLYIIHDAIDSWSDNMREKVFKIYAEFLNEFATHSF